MLSGQTFSETTSTSILHFPVEEFWSFSSKSLNLFHQCRNFPLLHYKSTLPGFISHCVTHRQTDRQRQRGRHRQGQGDGPGGVIQLLLLLLIGCKRRQSWRYVTVSHANSYHDHKIRNITAPSDLPPSSNTHWTWLRVNYNLLSKILN